MAEVDTLTIRGPDDFHVHLRDGELASRYARTLSESCSRALVMPNTNPPITSVERLDRYHEAIRSAAPDLEPLMTFKLAESLTQDAIADLATAGAIAGKYYPVGVTTNSEDGIRSPDHAAPLFEAMQEAKLNLCIHAESPVAEVLDRETEFLPDVERVAARYPDLKIVIEHVSTRDAVKLVEESDGRFGATVTVHHLLYSLDDLLGSGLRPHLYCKPLVKTHRDREAIQRVVLEGHQSFFYGSDSAPHAVETKECACGAAGVYSAPTAIPLLIRFFEEHGELGKLEPFVSEYGARHYGIPRSVSSRAFRRLPWRVPLNVDGAVPLGAGEVLDWSVSAGLPPRATPPSG